MANKKTNKKLHKTKVDEQEIEPLYGYIHGEWDALGGHHLTYRNPDENEKSYSESLNPSGSFSHTSHDSDDKEHHGSLHPGEIRNYIGGGKSVQIDGHYDHNGEKTGRMEHAGDFGQATPKNYYRGTGKKEFKMSGDSQYHGVQQGSAPVHCRTRAGTDRAKVKGDKFLGIEGDHCTMGENNKIEVYNKEISTYSGGNHDVYSDKKYHVFSKDAFTANTDSTFDTHSKSDTTIQSDSKITIKVGSSSIVIESGSITIKSPQIKFEQG